MEKKKVLETLEDNFNKIAENMYPGLKAFEILNDLIKDNKDYKKAKSIFLQYWHDKGLICEPDNF